MLLIYCNSYQQNLKVLFKFFPNKLFGQLLYISPENLGHKLILHTMYCTFHAIYNI